MDPVATRRPYTGEARDRSQTVAIELVAGDWTLGQVFSPQEIRFSSFGIIPPVLHTFIYP